MRARARDDGKPAGQRRVRTRVRARQTRRSATRASAGNAAGQRRVRAQVASDFYPVSTSCGYRVSCAETLGVDGFLARWAVRAGAPDFLAMSERFA